MGNYKMRWITLLGFVAATLTTLSFLPQVHKAWITKRCDDLSAGMLFSLGSGACLWLVYGVIVRAAPIIVANLVTLPLVMVLIVLKLRYRTEP
jgi:MtN3 and saliva related transmembrane protein